MFKMFQDFFNALSLRISNRPTSRVVMVLLVMVGASAAQADVYQWQWADPTDPNQGKVESATLCPDGAGLTITPDLAYSGFDLTKAYLSQVDLRTSFFHSIFTDGYFAQSNLMHALFLGCDITHGDFTKIKGASSHFWYAALDDADFSMADLTGGRIEESSLVNANFSGTNLTNTRIEFTNLTGANFTNAIINGTGLDGAVEYGFTALQLYATASYKNHDVSAVNLIHNNMSGWDFHEVNLTLAQLGYSKLQHARFVGATLSHTSFDNSDLANADFTDAKMAYVWMNNATLKSTNFRGADLSCGYFNTANFTNADLTGATIAGANLGYTTDIGFTAAQLYSTASYQNHNLRNIKLYSNNLSGWSFRGIDMTGVDLNSSRLVGTDFRDASLSGANLAASQLWDADLTGADLKGANMRSTDLRGAKNANLAGADTTAMIHPDGTIIGMRAVPTGSYYIENFGGSELIPIRVTEEVLRPYGIGLILDQNPWGSTITFDPGIQVDISGTLLTLTREGNIDPENLVGRSWKLFDWTGVNPVGEFVLNTDYLFEWDISQLYTDGTVTLIVVPEPATLGLLGLGPAILVRHGKRRCMVNRNIRNA